MSNDPFNANRQEPTVNQDTQSISTDNGLRGIVVDDVMIEKQDNGPLGHIAYVFLAPNTGIGDGSREAKDAFYGRLRVIFGETVNLGEGHRDNRRFIPLTLLGDSWNSPAWKALLYGAFNLTPPADEDTQNLGATHGPLGVTAYRISDDGEVSTLLLTLNSPIGDGTAASRVAFSNSIVKELPGVINVIIDQYLDDHVPVHCVTIMRNPAQVSPKKWMRKLRKAFNYTPQANQDGKSKNANGKKANKVTKTGPQPKGRVKPPTGTRQELGFGDKTGSMPDNDGVIQPMIVDLPRLTNLLASIVDGLVVEQDKPGDNPQAPHGSWHSGESITSNTIAGETLIIEYRPNGSKRIVIA